MYVHTWDNIIMFTHIHPHSHSHRVVLRGDKDENAVLCTNNSTYDLRIGETSNSLLLCPSLLYPNEPGKLDNN